jgi:hypothetical protein
MHWQRARAAGGAAQHSHGTTHSHTGQPTAVHLALRSLQRPAPVTPGQHLLCTRLLTWGGGDDRRPVSSPHTPSLNPTPLLCEAKLSEAKLWPCPTPSLPPSPSPQAHTCPCSRLEGPCTGGPIKALGEWEGLEKASDQDKRRGEEKGVGAAEGPARARVHVTRQGHRRHGQGKRAPTQAPPALDDRLVGWGLPGDVLCVLLCLSVCWCEGTQFMTVCTEGCVYLDRWVQRRACDSCGGGWGRGAGDVWGARVAVDAEQT